MKVCSSNKKWEINGRQWSQWEEKLPRQYPSLNYQPYAPKGLGEGNYRLGCVDGGRSIKGQGGYNTGWHLHSQLERTNNCMSCKHNVFHMYINFCVEYIMHFDITLINEHLWFLSGLCSKQSCYYCLLKTKAGESKCSQKEDKVYLFVKMTQCCISCDWKLIEMYNLLQYALQPKYQGDTSFKAHWTL